MTHHIVQLTTRRMCGLQQLLRRIQPSQQFQTSMVGVAIAGRYQQPIQLPGSIRCYNSNHNKFTPTQQQQQQQQQRPFNIASTTTTTIIRQQQQQQQMRYHGGSTSTGSDSSAVKLVFLQPDGISQRIVSANVGETLLQVAHRNEIDLEGACEGVCACSTCHVILPINIYDALPAPSEEEEDMLDMAFGLTETSRLGCQITVTPEMDHMLITMPKATRNFYVDGHKPKPH